MSYNSTILGLQGLTSYLPLGSDAIDTQGVAWAFPTLEHSQRRRLSTDPDSMTTRFNDDGDSFSTDASLLDRSNGFTASVLFSGRSLNGSDIGSIFSNYNTAGDALFMLFRSSSSTRFRLFIRDDNSDVLVDEEFGRQNILDDFAPHQIIWTEDGERNYRLYLDGEQVLSGQYPANAMTFDRFAWASDSNPNRRLSTFLSNAFILNRELEENELASLIRQVHLHAGGGRPMSSHDTLYASREDSTEENRQSFLVEITEPCALMAAVVNRIGSTSGALARMRIHSIRGSGSGDVSFDTGSVVASGGDIFGRFPGIQTLSTGVVSELIQPGKYWVDIFHFQVDGELPEGFALMRTEANSTIMPDVKDAVSGFKTVSVGETIIHYQASLGTDRRGIKVVTPDGSQTYELDDGFTPNDVNHAGGALLVTSTGGLLVAHVGHNDPNIRCNYFDDVTNLSGNPTASYTLLTGSASYPNLVELADGTVMLAYRGSIAEEPARHQPAIIRFNPSDGSGAQIDIVAGFSNGTIGDGVEDGVNMLRAYPVGYQKGVGTDGNEHVAITWNLRSWVTGEMVAISSMIYSPSDNQWRSPNGDLLGNDQFGGDGADARIDAATMLLPIDQGGASLALPRDGNNQVVSGGSGSAIVDVTNMPASATVFAVYTHVNRDGNLIFAGNAAIETSSFDGQNITHNGVINTPQLWSAANGSIVTKHDDGTYRLGLVLWTRIFRHNASSEILGTYYRGWRAGNVLIGYELQNPFNNPTFVQQWTEETAYGLGELRPIQGSEQWRATVARSNVPHGVLLPSDAMVVDPLTGQIALSPSMMDTVVGDTEQCLALIKGTVSANQQLLNQMATSEQAVAIKADTERAFKDGDTIKVDVVASDDDSGESLTALHTRVGN